MPFKCARETDRLRLVAKRTGTHFVITAVLTDTGEPTYFTPDGRWSSALSDAEALATAQERDSRLQTALAQERQVCDPYAFGVALDAEGIDPLTMRERIRAAGPTTRLRRPD